MTTSNNTSGTIGTINSSSGTISTINNNGGNIGTISTGKNSATTINNDNYITSITTGANSNVTINNAGAIKTIATGNSGYNPNGTGSVATINNTGFINKIEVGKNGTLDGVNAGYVYWVTGGTGSKTTNKWTTTSEASILLIQNQFILDYYLPKEEQNVGVGVSRIGGTLYRDISVPVTNALERDVWEFEERRGGNFIDNNLWFAGETGDQGRWNIKANRGTTWTETLGIPFWGYSTRMVLNGMIVKVEDVGNITYGYLGTAAAMFELIQRVGSAANHFKNHGFSDWDNEFADQAWFRVGIDWYISTHK